MIFHDHSVVAFKGRSRYSAYALALYFIISLTDGCLTGQVNFFIFNSSKYCKTAKVIMEIVIPSYSIVCTTFSISLVSLRVINPSLVHSLDFIALQH